MAREVREFSVTVPVTTPPSAPHRQALAMPPRIVRRVTVRVPPGPRGEVGWAIANAETAIIPLTPGQWMVLDDQTVTLTLSGYIDSGTWAMVAYNTGGYSHTLTVEMTVTVPVTGATGPATTAGTVPVVGMTGSGGLPVTPGSTPVAVVPPPATPTPTPPTATTPAPPAIPTLPAPPTVTVPTPAAPTLPAPPTF